MDNKITVLGIKESGKTTYLAGMYICMSAGVKNFSLVAKDPNQDMYLEKLWEKISNGEKPYPTDKSEQYHFHIAHNYKPVMDFDWKDYPGGILAEPSAPECQNLIQDVKDSDCLLLILDGRLFVSGNRDEYEAGILNRDEYKDEILGKIKYDTGVRAEIKMFQRLSDENLKLPPVGIVVTKCDLIPPTYKPVVQEIIREIFSQLIGESERVVLLMSVTLGGDIVPGFVPKPSNIEQPIAFSVLAILMKYLALAKMQKDKNANYIKKYPQIGRLFNPGKLDKARQNAKELQELIDKLSDDAYKLIELFSDEKTIYVDGAEKNLRDYYKDAFQEISQ